MQALVFLLTFIPQEIQTDPLMSSVLDVQKQLRIYTGAEKYIVCTQLCTGMLHMITIYIVFLRW